MYTTISFEVTSSGHYREVKIALASNNFPSAVIEANAICLGYYAGRGFGATIQSITAARPKGEVLKIGNLKYINKVVEE